MGLHGANRWRYCQRRFSEYTHSGKSYSITAAIFMRFVPATTMLKYGPTTGLHGSYRRAVTLITVGLL